METNDGSLDYAREENAHQNQISAKRRLELENLLGFRVCPFVSEEITYLLHIGIYLNAGPVYKYFCSVNGGIASGGVPSTIMFFTAIQPCPLEYAESCNLYKRRSNI